MLDYQIFGSWTVRDTDWIIKRIEALLDIEKEHKNCN